MSGLVGLRSGTLVSSFTFWLMSHENHDLCWASVCAECRLNGGSLWMPAGGSLSFDRGPIDQSESREIQNPTPKNQELRTQKRNVGFNDVVTVGPWFLDFSHPSASTTITNLSSQSKL